MSTKRLTFAAMMVALSVVILFVAALFPVVELSLCAIAAVGIALTNERCGLATGLTAYAATTALAWLLLPDKYPAVCYTMLFGLYPVIKELAERAARRMPLKTGKICGWLIKLGAVNVLAVAAAALFSAMFLGEGEPYWYLPLMLGLYNCVILVYDVALGRILQQMRKRTKGKKL